MSESRQISAPKTGVSKLAIVALSLIFVAGLFVVGIDQGQIINFVFAEGSTENPIDPMILHEFSHDMRHAAGFPCH